MRRHKKSNFKAFLHGFILAGLPIAAFMGADYLMAPPSAEPSFADVATTNGRQDSRDAVAGFNSGDQNGNTFGVGQQARAIPVRQTASVADAQPAPAKTGLVAAIQHELKRVGCYSGDPDGVWSDRTRVAMQAFNSSVHVGLQTAKPDYILLTLLQGHNSKACARSCDGVGGRGEACVDKSIEARAVAPPLAAPKTVGSVAPSTWTSTVVVAAPGKTTTEILAPGPAAAPKVVAVGTKPTVTEGKAAVANIWGTDTQQAGATSATNSAEQRDANAALPGRMAIGVLEGPARSSAVVPPFAKSQRTEARREGSSRIRAASSAGGGRLRSTFSELGRHSP